MVAASHQPRVVGLSGGWSGSSADGADALAVGSEDGDTVVLRIANWRGTPLQFSLAVDWLGSSGSDGGGGGAPEQPLHVHGALRVHTEMLRGVRGEHDAEAVTATIEQLQAEGFVERIRGEVYRLPRRG
jgi:hypothetical protein